MTVRLACVLILCAAGGVKAQALHDDSARVLFEANLRALAKLAVPFELRGPLSNAIPARVQITRFVWNPPVATLTVAAQGFDDVTAFLLGLRELVSSPWGLTRVVERKGMSRARVLLMNGEVLEFDSVELGPLFPDVALHPLGCDECAPDGGPIELAITFTLPARPRVGKTQVVANLERLQVPARYLQPLAVALPPRVRVIAFETTAASVTIRGEAATLDDVSEFMRGLNNVVGTPRGHGRVVERKRDGHFRVELVDGGEVLEFSRDQIHGVFSGLELTSTAVGPPATFELMMPLP